MSSIQSEWIKKHGKQWELSSFELMAKTKTSDVYKIMYDGEPHVLKILNETGKRFESLSASVLHYWEGAGAVHLVREDREGGALLLEYLPGPNLTEIVKTQSDDIATQVICETLDQLHLKRNSSPLAQQYAHWLQASPQRVLQFAYVHGALSASWELDEGRRSSRRERIAEMIEKLL